jgi:hypothetical protein
VTWNESGVLYLIPVDETNTGPRALTNLIASLQSDAQPFVYTVEPKESAQNLSDTSAREAVKNLSLALAAAIPQLGTTASAYLNYIKRTQSLLETIKRKPLLVGFIKDATNFGWIVGPRFKIGDNLKLDYEHTALQRSVQATIAVPAWWTSVTITTSNQWLDGNANPVVKPPASTVR